MTRRKGLNFVLSVLVFILAVSAALFGGVRAKQTLEVESAIRTIDADEIETLAYKENLQKLVDQFEDIETVKTDSNLTFEAKVKEKAVDAENEYTKKIFTDYDLEQNIFTYTEKYYDENDEFVFEHEMKVTPQYDEEIDEVYFIDENNQKILIRDVLEVDGVNECVAVTAAVGGVSAAAAGAVIAGALIVSIIACDPTIIETTITTVKTVVTWVQQAVRSILRWFIRIFTWVWTAVYTTIVSTTVVRTITPTTVWQGVKFETREFSRDRVKEGRYYLALVESNKTVYISTVDVSFDTAVAVLAAAQLQYSAFQEDFVITLSIYTYNSVDADKAAKTAGGGFSTAHLSPKIGEFKHYHPGLVQTSHAHSLFGLPCA